MGGLGCSGGGWGSCLEDVWESKGLSALFLGTETKPGHFSAHGGKRSCRSRSGWGLRPFLVTRSSRHGWEWQCPCSPGFHPPDMNKKLVTGSSGGDCARCPRSSVRAVSCRGCSWHLRFGLWPLEENGKEKLLSAVFGPSSPAPFPSRAPKRGAAGTAPGSSKGGLCPGFRQEWKSWEQWVCCPASLQGPWGQN